jgi:hypothetical protein
MTEEAASLQCAEHGQAFPTYVCGHLHGQPGQRWFCDAPQADYPYPDAWCGQCDTELHKQGGEWNEHNEGCLDLRVICHHCYQGSMAQSVQAMDGPLREAWIDTVVEGHEALVRKQKALESEHGISRFERWDYDQAQGTLAFSHAGVPRVLADIEFIGSIGKASGTWQWAWANFHHHAKVVSRIPAVRKWGEAQGFLPLTVPLWDADTTDGWELSGVAAQLLGARGVYRAPSDNGYLFMALMSIRTLA